MKVMDAVLAHLAAEGLGKQIVPYETALALIKVKRATQDEMEFYTEGERELVEKFAAVDENGNIRMNGQGSFVLRDSGLAGEYEQKHRALGETETKIQFTPLRVKAPDQIKPEWIEALEGFIEFT